MASAKEGLVLSYHAVPLGHVGSPIVGLRLSTFRINVRLAVRQKCHPLRLRIFCVSWRITAVRVTQEDLQRQRSAATSSRATVPRPDSNPPPRGVAQPLDHVQSGPRARTKPGYGRTTRSWSAAGTATGFKGTNRVLHRPQPAQAVPLWSTTGWQPLSYPHLDSSTLHRQHPA